MTEYATLNQTVFAATNTQHTNHSVGSFDLVGVAASPPMGGGNGQLLVYHSCNSQKIGVPLSAGANGFRVAVVGDTVYIPTLQGTTYVVNLKSHTVRSRGSNRKCNRKQETASYNWSNGNNGLLLAGFEKKAMGT